MRKPSGKPGAKHLIALQNAHGKGDFNTSRRAALDYAKECTAHCKAEHPGESHVSAMTVVTGPSKATPDRKKQLAALAMKRGKKAV